MPAFDAVQNLQNDLIRKALDGSVFRAPRSAAALDETSLFDNTTGEIRAAGLPAGYTDLGYTSDDGAQHSKETEFSEVSSWQSKTPTRSDVTSESYTVQVACQETKLATIGLYLNVDTASITPRSNGVVRIDSPDTPPDLRYRVLSIAADQSSYGEIIIAKYLPNAKVTSFDGQNFGKGDDPISWPVTFTGFKDDTLGSAHSTFFGGAGWLALLTKMGFTLAAAAVPVITSASRSSLNTAGGQTVTIRGRGFSSVDKTSAAAVKFAGTNATNFEVVDDGIIVATAPAHAAGSGPIVVTNLTGASTTGPTVTYA